MEGWTQRSGECADCGGTFCTEHWSGHNCGDGSYQGKRNIKGIGGKGVRGEGGSKAVGNRLGMGEECGMAGCTRKITMEERLNQGGNAGKDKEDITEIPDVHKSMQSEYNYYPSVPRTDINYSPAILPPQPPPGPDISAPLPPAFSSEVCIPSHISSSPAPNPSDFPLPAIPLSANDISFESINRKFLPSQPSIPQTRPPVYITVPEISPVHFTADQRMVVPEKVNSEASKSLHKKVSKHQKDFKKTDGETAIEQTGERRRRCFRCSLF